MSDCDFYHRNGKIQFREYLKSAFNRGLGSVYRIAPESGIATLESQLFEVYPLQQPNVPNSGDQNLDEGPEGRCEPMKKCALYLDNVVLDDS